jgi:hypothetical protein
MKIDQEIIDKDYNMFEKCAFCGKPRTQFIQMVKWGTIIAQPVCDSHYQKYKKFEKDWENIL